MDSRDFACVILPDLDYDAQLIAIRHLFRVHENVDQDIDREIKEIEEFAKTTKGRRNEHAVDEWVDRLHSSVYQSAAHSMSAVGMLAPLMESIFLSTIPRNSQKFIHRETKSEQPYPLGSKGFRC